MTLIRGIRYIIRRHLGIRLEGKFCLSVNLLSRHLRCGFAGTKGKPLRPHVHAYTVGMWWTGGRLITNQNRTDNWIGCRTIEKYCDHLEVIWLMLGQGGQEAAGGGCTSLGGHPAAAEVGV